jgi:CheY-like chemotaxis protein
MNIKEELTTIDKYIGKQLREKRLNRGFTLACVASYLGRSYQQVQKYEQAQSRISAPLLFRLASFYGISIDKFFEGVTKSKENNKIPNGLIPVNKDAINILLVEDNPGDEAIARRALNSFQNINILCVHDGVQTLEVLRYKTLCSDFPRPTLIFLDLAIPKKDGMSILKEIKRDLTMRDIPVIILTSNMNNEIMSNAYKNGASGYIQKSFEFTDFQKNMEDCVTYWSKAVVLPTQ